VNSGARGTGHAGDENAALAQMTCVAHHPDASTRVKGGTQCRSCIA
jgi:hypothetical protein